MNDNLQVVLLEIEEIIAKIGNYDIGQAKFSAQGKNELIALFKEKLKDAKSISEKLKLVG